MVKPKLRIKKVFNKVVENGGNDIGKIMIEEGYSPNTAKTPQKITESKSWQQLLEEELPESLITGTHKEAFLATKTISARIINSKGSQEANSQTDDFIDVPDWQTRIKAVELGYKLRSRLTERTDLTNSDKSLAGLIQINETTK